HEGEHRLGLVHLRGGDFAAKNLREYIVDVVHFLHRCVQWCVAGCGSHSARMYLCRAHWAIRRALGGLGSGQERSRSMRVWGQRDLMPHRGYMPALPNASTTRRKAVLSAGCSASNCTASPSRRSGSSTRSSLLPSHVGAGVV